MSTLYEIPVTTLAGEPTTLAPYQGHVLLIVNTASQCGFTPQYEGLEKLYNTYKHSGFEVLGFPANDFGAQEPGTNTDIKTFCETSFGVTFPIFEKIAVTGPETHPLYQFLTTAQPETHLGDPKLREGLDGFLASINWPTKTNPAPGVLWNFEKFLVDRKGNVVARFASDIAPSDPALIQAIEAALPPL
jgi:glutathione peroxidase